MHDKGLSKISEAIFYPCSYDTIQESVSEAHCVLSILLRMHDNYYLKQNRSLQMQNIRTIQTSGTVTFHGCFKTLFIFCSDIVLFSAVIRYVIPHAIIY